MNADALIFYASKDKFTLQECERLAQDLDCHDSMTFELVGPKGRLPAKWLDAYFGFFMIEGQTGFNTTSQLQYVRDIHCENLRIPAQAIEAGTVETERLDAQHESAVRKDAPNT